MRPITDPEDLRRHLQWAVEVEHATIPPYEYAMWSIVDAESDARLAIKYVVREEMLHLALAANLLSAVGGTPAFTGEHVPRFPAPMPHHSPDAPLILHLAPASRELVRDVFLPIEQPREANAPPEADRYDTLGQFYEAVADAIDRLGAQLDLFASEPARQITTGYAGHGGGALFAITDRDTAVLAIEEIVEQGEGGHDTRLEPFGFEGAPEPGHYWRFLEIAEGRTPLGEVHPMRVDPTTGDLPPGDLRDLSRLFDAAYSLQLQVMERAWAEGDASPLIEGAMVPLMNHAQKPIARALIASPWPGEPDMVAGPSFAWDPMPLDDMRTLAARLGEAFDLGPTRETLDQVAGLWPG